MNERNLTSELAAVRATQADLLRRLETIDARIKEIEARAAQVEPPKTEPPHEEPPPSPPVAAPVPPPLPATPIVTPPESAPSVEPPPQRTESPPVPPPPPRESFELRLGRVWLVRAGIVILLTGLVFLGNFAWQEVVTKLGAGGKLTLIYLAGAALAAGGFFARCRSPQLRHFGNVLAGGGLAAVYYATYAAHFVPALCVIPSPLLGGILLVALAGAILLLAVRLRLESVAAVTTALAFYTAAINPVDGFSLFSNLLLSIVAVALLVRQRWSSLPCVGLAGCYLAFVFWRFQQAGGLFTVRIEDAAVFRTAILFPACYWVVFTVAAFLGRDRRFPDAGRATFLTLNNGAFYALAAPVFAGSHPGQLWLFTLGFGALLLVLSVWSGRRGMDGRLFDGSYLAQGLALVTLGLFLKFSGPQAALLFALQAVTMMKMSRARNGGVFQFFCGIAALLATVMALEGIFSDEPRAALTSGAVALALAATAWIFKHQRGLLAAPSIQWRSVALVALATGIGVCAIADGTQAPGTIILFAALGVAGVLSLRLHGMPELTLAGQIFQFAALLRWLALADAAAPVPAAALAASLLVQIHWWNRQRRWAVSAAHGFFWQGVWSIALVTVLLVWADDRFVLPARLPVVAALGLVLVLHACRTRCLALLAASQLCSLVAMALFGDIVGNDGHAGHCLAALGLFLLQSAATRSWTQPCGRAVWFARRGIELLASVGAMALVEAYLPAPWVSPVLALLAFLCFGVAAARRTGVPLPPAALLMLASLAESLDSLMDGTAVSWLALSAPLFLLLTQRIGNARLKGQAFYPRPVGIVSIVAGVLWLWLLVWKIVSAASEGFLITVSWSVLASLVLALGFLLRERPYRLLGLAILAASVARIFLVDVWELQTIYRIVSFLVLGGLLVASGFLYNRYAEAIRRLM